MSKLDTLPGQVISWLTLLMCIPSLPERVNKCVVTRRHLETHTNHDYIRGLHD